ncbi:hypothetical protein D9M68_827820 [compost metagenome]
MVHHLGGLVLRGSGPAHAYGAFVEGDLHLACGDLVGYLYLAVARGVWGARRGELPGWDMKPHVFVAAARVNVLLDQDLNRNKLDSTAFGQWATRLMPYKVHIGTHVAADESGTAIAVGEQFVDPSLRRAIAPVQGLRVKAT